MDEKKCLIVDQGAESIRAGIVPDASPTFNTPSIMEGTKLPLISKNNITSFDGLESIWLNIFKTLCLDPIDNDCFFINNGLTPLSQQRTFIEILFEKYRFGRVLFANTLITTLYSTGGDTGLVLECGYSNSQVLPIYRGYAISPGTVQSAIAGFDCTEFLMEKLQMLEKTNITLCSAKDIKEKYGYVRMSKETEAKEVVMPDGKKITLNEELWKCSELLFNPTSFSIEALGLAKMCFKSIKRSDIDTRKDLYENIIPIGGTACFYGFNSRLRSDLQKMCPSMNIVVQDQEDKALTSWIGAYVIACTEVFSKLTINKGEYKERGTNIVTRFLMY